MQIFAWYHEMARAKIFVVKIPNQGKNVFPYFVGNGTCYSAMNDFPVIGDPCFAHRILGSPGGKHCESLKRNVWGGVVSPLKAVSLDRECHILP